MIKVYQGTTDMSQQMGAERVAREAAAEAPPDRPDVWIAWVLDPPGGDGHPYTSVHSTEASARKRLEEKAEAWEIPVEHLNAGIAAHIVQS